MKQRPHDIFALSAAISELRKSIRAAAIINAGMQAESTVTGTLHGHMTIIKRLMPLTGYEKLLSHERYAGSDRHLRFARAAIEKGHFGKAEGHLHRFTEIVRPTANDNPFRKGDHVWVNRYEHGWEVGEGVVIEVFGTPPEIVRYTVCLAAGGVIHVDHTRDLSRA